MAADGAAPWSRWDVPGSTSQNVANGGGNSQFLQQRQFDAVGLGQTQVATSNALRGPLQEQRINPLDPNFYDCVFSIGNNGQTLIEQCYKEVGCCAGGCCHNHYWHEKYGWAVALIVIFCFFVILGFAVWLIVWLLNRAKDKRLKREMMYQPQEEDISPATSQASLAQSPIQQNGYYPPYGVNSSQNGHRY